MRYFIIILLSLSFSSLGFTQESRLAQQYYNNGEFEKASVLFNKLYRKNNNNAYYFNRYMDCLISLEQYQQCEAIIKRELKNRPDDIELYVSYGNLFERQYMEDKATEKYRFAIQKLPPNKHSVLKLANAFTGLTKYDLALETFERGSKLLKDDKAFAYNLGDLYRRKGDTPNMIKHYLLSLEENPARLNSLKTNFQRYLSGEDDFLELQTQLYEQIQENTDGNHFPELLAWVFIQRKDYKNALRQVRALDRKLKENGGRVFKLGEVAENDKDYDVAIEAFDYIVENKTQTSSYYLEAKRKSLDVRRKKLVQGFDYTETDLRELENQYEVFLNEFGRNKTTAPIIAELADLEAFYLNDLDKAISLLNELVEYPNVNRIVLANSKIRLGDFYLMKGEIWEATLLYSQVDKAFKDDLLGQEARFRNAKLSYYNGDFQWAQTQFDVLKASTSKLIANDALDLSVFIMDNLGLDTTATALELYAKAELLVFQNRFDDAFQKFDSLLLAFPEHTLEDDVLYAKAKVFLKKKEFTKAVENFQKIADEYSDGIRADNSLFELANLYETHLNDLEKAKNLYEKIFIEFSNSTFAVESRKRYRKLRGDDIQ